VPTLLRQAKRVGYFFFCETKRVGYFNQVVLVLKPVFIMRGQKKSSLGAEKRTVGWYTKHEQYRAPGTIVRAFLSSVGRERRTSSTLFLSHQRINAITRK
jgi:hypothetical protein